jgi:hypothetical protein
MTVRSLAIVGLAAALLAAFMCGPAAAQVSFPINPQPQPIPLPIVYPCTQIASFSPASARPGENVDIHLKPPAGQTFHGYTVTGVQFAGNIPATFTNVAPHHVRAKVPLAAGTGPVRVTCRITVTGWNAHATSVTAFTPTSFGLSFMTNPVDVVVGTTTNATVSLSHPAPEPVTLTLAPQNTSLSVRGLNPGASGTLTIPTGQQSAVFSVGAHLAPTLGGNIIVSGTNVATATLGVTVPTPAFSLVVPDDEAEVNWGDSASYSVELESHNGFAGTVALTASGLPDGATAAPVNVTLSAGGSATATFSVATAQSATELGSDSFTLRGTSPGAPNRSDTLELRALPDAGVFGGLAWRSSSDTCGNFEANVTDNPAGTPDTISFDGPGFAPTQAHTHLKYAFTPDCRGAVVIGAAVAAGGPWPASIFNLGFDGSIADAPGSRLNMGTAAWKDSHFKVSPDGSFLIGVSLNGNHRANLYDMLDLAQRPPGDNYSLAESLAAEIEPGGNVVKATPSGSSDDWEWTLP